MALSFESLSHWMLGHSARAVERNDSALAFAAEVDHPFTLSQCHAMAAFLHLLRGDVAQTKTQSELAAEIADRQGFPYLVASEQGLDKPENKRRILIIYLENYAGDGQSGHIYDLFERRLGDFAGLRFRCASNLASPQAPADSARFGERALSVHSQRQLPRYARTRRHALSPFFQVRAFIGNIDFREVCEGESGERSDVSHRVVFTREISLICEYAV